MEKTRVICISCPLRATEAESFARHFRDIFECKFVYSGFDDTNGHGKIYPKYWVVRLPLKGESVVDGHEMQVNKIDVLERIITSDKTLKCA
jgi:hypothetical protein